MDSDVEMMESTEAEVQGVNLPTVVDLKKSFALRATVSPRVLEDYLRNAACIINNLRARLERSELQAHEVIEVPGADLSHASLSPTQEQLEVFRELLEYEREVQR
uniref:Uncharacterized protein n=2 Tax=Wuchereria bancrofti TaxID=6293 RepID=A0A1I8EW87_WUCBA